MGGREDMTQKEGKWGRKREGGQDTGDKERESLRNMVERVSDRRKERVPLQMLAHSRVHSRAWHRLVSVQKCEVWVGT
jgi:hypothetical protein